MNVLLSGASGFLGKEIVDFFKQNVSDKLTTLGRSSSNDIICDLSAQKPLITDTYKMVIHAAGKAHSIPKTAEEKEEFYKVNYLGTKHLLNALQGNLPNTFVLISSVAVYGLDYGIDIKESFDLKGDTPYAKSKIKAEIEVESFCKKNNVNFVILRLPLISGKNPPGNLGAMINAIKKGYYFRIGKGEARKSVVSSSDIAKFIPNLYGKNGVYNLTDTLHPTFAKIENHIAGLYGKKIRSFPKFIFKALALIGDILPFFIINTNKLKKITESLTFSDKKAVKELNWNPNSAIESIK